MASSQITGEDQRRGDAREGEADQFPQQIGAGVAAPRAVRVPFSVFSVSRAPHASDHAEEGVGGVGISVAARRQIVGAGSG